VLHLSVTEFANKVFLKQSVVQEHEMINFGGQKVKGRDRGHTAPKYVTNIPVKGRSRGHTAPKYVTNIPVKGRGRGHTAPK